MLCKHTKILLQSVSLALDESSVMQHFEHDYVTKVCDGIITWDWHMYVTVSESASSMYNKTL